MKRELITTLTDHFELHAQSSEAGIEYWLARDLQHLLGYTEWRNFLLVLGKAKTACDISGHEIQHHFVDVNKMVKLGSGSEREIDDLMLTRYACYLIAQNGDPRKEQIAFAQTYFAMQTRRAELIEERILEQERLSARKKLTQTEKELSQVIYEQTGQNCNFGIIRSKGDQALFSKSTQQMKAQWKIPGNRPLADFATEITIHNARENSMSTEAEISGEHVTNNYSVRKTLIERGIRPESLTPAEDIKKIERRIVSQEKTTLATPNSLSRKDE